MRIALFLDPTNMIIMVMKITLFLQRRMCSELESRGAIKEINLCAGTYNKDILLIHKKANK